MMPRCRETKPDGTPCERVVPATHGYCYSHDPGRAEERKHNAQKAGRGKTNGELGALKKQLHNLAVAVLDGETEKGKAAVVNQIYNTVVRAIEQERKNRETGELAERLESLEEVLKGRKTG